MSSWSQGTNFFRVCVFFWVNDAVNAPQIDIGFFFLLFYHKCGETENIINCNCYKTDVPNNQISPLRYALHTNQLRKNGSIFHLGILKVNELLTNQELEVRVYIRSN